MNSSEEATLNVRTDKYEIPARLRKRLTWSHLEGVCYSHTARKAGKGRGIAMKYRELGKTGLKVSEIGFGGEHLEGKPFETVDAVVNTALDGGVNIIDVFMPQPQVRSDLGQAIGSRRKDVILQGHIGAVMEDGQYKRSRDPQICDRYVKDFMERFRTDYIDLGMLHFIDTEEDYRSAFETDYIEYACSLKRKGIIRFLGVSSHNPETAVRMVETGLIDMMMFAVNPAFDMSPNLDLDSFFEDGRMQKLEQDPVRSKLYSLCAAKGVGITVMKALGAGRLLNAESSAFGTALTLPQCVSYALDRPAVSSVLLGAKTPEEMREALAYEETTAVQRDYTVMIEGGLPLLGGKCMYCNHCLPCVKNIDVAAVTKYLDMARAGGETTAKEHYLALAAHGSDCIGCGVCEKNCPFHISVRENMAEAVKVFGA